VGDQVKEDETWWDVARMNEMRSAYEIFVAKPKGKRPLGRLRRSKWEDNIRVDV
jgi:hypothetical protein